MQIRNTSKILTTPESIVREFRREAIRQAQDEKPISTFQPYRVIPQFHPSFIRKIYDRINWDVVLEWACWAVMILCLIYIGIFVMAPFVKVLR